MLFGKYFSGSGSGHLAGLGLHLVTDNVNGNSQNDDSADDDVLNVVGSAHQVQAVADDSHDHGANQGAPDGALTTGEGSAADDAGRDGVVIIGGTGIAVGGSQTANGDHAGHTGHEAGQGIDEGQHVLGGNTGQAGALGRPPEVFYPVAILTTFLSSFLPFFLANIVAIPVMKLINLIKNKYGIVLCVTILVVVGIFVAYMQLLKSLVGFYIEKDMALFSPEVMGRIGKFAAGAFPFNLYANMLLGRHPYINLIYVLLLTTGVGLIAMLIVKKWYFSTILDGIENQRASFTKRTSDNPLPPFLSYMRRDFYGILRSFNYSFQYLVMAAAAPVMVYYCNALAGSVGSNSVGNNILPGISLMVITIFVTVIVSFSSTAISREGGCFYHTKIIPMPYWKQVLAKFLLYSGVATLSIILCCIAVSGAKFVSPVDAVMIFFIAEFSNIALTSLCMWFDTKSPTFNFMGDGELVSANKNVAIALALGLVFAVLYGLFTMIGGFLPTFAGIPIKHGAKSIMGLLLIVSGVAAALGIVLLFVKLNKRYNKLYQ